MNMKCDEPVAHNKTALKHDYGTTPLIREKLLSVAKLSDIYTPAKSSYVLVDTHTHSQVTCFGDWMSLTCELCLHDDGLYFALLCVCVAPVTGEHLWRHNNTHCRCIRERHRETHGSVNKTFVDLSLKPTLDYDWFDFCPFFHKTYQIRNITAEMKRLVRELWKSYISDPLCSFLSSSGSPFGAPFPYTGRINWVRKWEQEVYQVNLIGRE